MCASDQSQISWAYFQNVVMTNEIARLLIIMYTTSFTTVKFY